MPSLLENSGYPGPDYLLSGLRMGQEGHQAQSTGLQDTPAPASDGEGEVQPASTTPRMNTRLRTRVCHSLYPQWPCAPLSYTLPDDRQPPP